jgi:hypothetical protein
VSTISLLGCSTSVALATGPTDEEEEEDVGLQPLACRDHGFESHRGHGCLSVVSVVCRQVEVSVTS